MSDATCKTCPWWNLSGKESQRGQCRKHAPVFDGEAAHSMGAELSEPLWPVTLSTEWCGEHPDRQPRLECATTTLVTNNSGGLSAADIYPIVEALEQMARCAARTKS